MRLFKRKTKKGTAESTKSETESREDKNVQMDTPSTSTPTTDVRKTDGAFGRPIQDIRVIGVGGAGDNTIQRMMGNIVDGVDLIALNTDAQHLLHVEASCKVLIGEKTTVGLGAGSVPQIGEKAAKESEEEIKQVVAGADIVFITCGLGGGTGTGASPVIAKIANDAGALVIAVASLPYTAEGDIRRSNAEYGIQRLPSAADTTIVLPNDKLLEAYPRILLQEAFKKSDEIIIRAVNGIAKLAFSGLFDFEELTSIIKNGYFGVVGFGEGSGDDKLKKSVENALSTPLVDVDLYHQSSKAMVSITGDKSISPFELQREISKIANRLILEEDDIIWGSFVDKSKTDYVETVIICTGIKSLKSPKKLETKYGVDFI